jgi:multidrug efflux pump subunit AcrA (membrane-fusion protein)
VLAVLGRSSERCLATTSQRINHGLIRTEKMNMSVGDLKVSETQEPKAAPQKNRRRRTFFAAGAIVCMVIALASRQLRAPNPQVHHPPSPAPAEMTVSVVHPEKVSSTVILDLPGQLQAYTDAPIFAQTSGYLKAWHFDIGAKVKANDILAEIDTPEVDQELAQAKAQLQVAQSALKLSQVTYQRNQDLFNRGVIAPQDLDTAADTYYEDQATAAAASEHRPAQCPRSVQARPRTIRWHRHSERYRHRDIRCRGFGHSAL